MPQHHTSQESNPFTKRITEIRETVTKSRRVGCTAARLKRCVTRSGLYRTHCVLGAVLGVVIGLVFFDLPTTRKGIEKRESLFRIVVSARTLKLLWPLTGCSPPFPLWQASAAASSTPTTSPCSSMSTSVGSVQFISTELLPSSSISSTFEPCPLSSLYPVLFCSLPSFPHPWNCAPSWALQALATRLHSHSSLLRHPCSCLLIMCFSLLQFSSSFFFIVVCVGYRPTSFIFILYVAVAFVYTTVTSNGVVFTVREAVW